MLKFKYSISFFSFRYLERECDDCVTGREGFLQASNNGVNTSY